MLKKQLGGMTAPKLRGILTIGIIVWIAVGAGAFWFFHKSLGEYAVEVKKVSAEASLSNENLATLQSLEKQLTDSRSSVERARSIVAASRQYEYQDQIVSDINRYARLSGVTVASYVFSDPNTKIPAPAAGTTGTTPAPTAAVPAGLKSTSVSIALKSPTRYESLMQFIHAIEQNLTKMQLSGVALTKDANSNGVTANSLTIEVYIR
jgi:hypothetical protein